MENRNYHNLIQQKEKLVAMVSVSRHSVYIEFYSMLALKALKIHETKDDDDIFPRQKTLFTRKKDDNMDI